MTDALFDADEFTPWRDHWVNMPAFSSEMIAPASSIVVNFANDADRQKFLSESGYSKDRKAAVVWPAPAKPDRAARERKPLPPDEAETRYPVYVISKGRAATPLTSRALDDLGIDHYVVVEPTEADEYAEAVGVDRLLVLPFHDLGQGSIPARNWVWEHSRTNGDRRHWLVDDNIRRFYRLNENIISPVVDFNPLTAIEDFADRYTNLPMAGPNYLQYADKRIANPPFRWNRRVYSCTLLSNDDEHFVGWRGRYNEDTDLTLRFLKAGYVTALFNHVLIDKATTMTLAGGNTDELYEQNDEFDGRLAMAESLVEQHPDVATVSWKWGRWQHHVNYEPFRSNRPIRRQEGG